MQLKNNQNFIKDIKNLIDSAKQKVIRSVDNQRVLLYWSIGERIFEEEQEGKNRAEYGKYLIKNLSQEIKPLYGSGYSIRQLELMRQLYRTFPNTNALRSQLNWSQYKLLIRIKDKLFRANLTNETKEIQNYQNALLKALLNYLLC